MFECGRRCRGEGSTGGGSMLKSHTVDRTMTPSSGWNPLLAGVMVALTTACASSSLAVRAEIQSLEDARSADFDRWQPLLVDSERAEERARAARAIGRLREESLAPLLRRAIELEQESVVTEELLFALGQTGDPESLGVVSARLHESEASVRVRALEALGKLGGDAQVAEVAAYLSDRMPEVRHQAALALVRLRGRRRANLEPLSPATAQTLIERLASMHSDSDAAVRWSAAYALSEIELDGRGEALGAFTGDEEPWARAFALRGLARLAAKESVPAGMLIRGAEDENVHVAASAVGGLAEVGGAEAFAVLQRALQRQGDARDFHVRRAAVSECAGWVGDETQSVAIADALRAALRDESLAVRCDALRALCSVEGERAVPVFRHFSRSESPYERAAAADGATSLPFEQVGLRLLEMVESNDGRTAVAALTALGSFPPSEAVRVAALESLGGGDLAREATALQLLGKVGHKGVDDTTAIAAYERLLGPDNVEARLEVIRAAVALSLDGDRLATWLERILDDDSRAVREAAADALQTLQGTRPNLAPRPGSRSSVSLIEGRDHFSASPNPHVLVTTERGEFELELFREDAPLHVANFLEFADSGRYDNLTFHRIVTGFVAQGFDPRGDGWGTGGVFLRDEINPISYRTGTLGMPNAGPDTAGCQIFLTHLPTPHLDGRYTVFGQVVQGMDVVDALDLADRVQSVQRVR